MASTALYRKYRSQSFEDVLGQEHVTETIQSSIREGRVGHAYLFSGSRGTGKTSTARILAKALNCEKGPTPTPCNVCDTCRAITDGSSLDVIEIDAASHGGVDDVRDLRENALLAPAVSRKKIYIVDEAHMVSTQGWNAFLKTVEEPPDHVVFVFATTEPHKVLPTILSRCQRFDFRRISSTTIAAHLAKVCAEEGITADDAALHLIARHAEGGMRDALSVLDQLLSSGSVTVADAARLLGSAGGDALFEFADALADSSTPNAVAVINRLVEDGQDLRVFAGNLLQHLRGLLLTKQVDNSDELIDATEETRARIASQAERFGAAKLVHLMRLFVDALTDMRNQTAPRLAMELAAVRGTMPQVDDSAVAALARIERLERLMEVGGARAEQPAATAPAATAPAATAPAATAPPATAPAATAPPATAPAVSAPSAPDPPRADAKPAKAPAADAPPAAPPSAPAAAPTKARARADAPPAETPSAPPETTTVSPPDTAAGLVDFDVVRRSWTLVLEDVRKRSKRLYALLAEASPQSFEGGGLVVGARYSWHAEKLTQPANASVLAAAVNEVLGVSPRISATVIAQEAPGPDEIDESRPAEENVDALEALKGAFGDIEVDE